jgi:hypothetical protein
MGKKLSEAEVARYEHDGLLSRWMRQPRRGAAATARPTVKRHFAGGPSNMPTRCSLVLLGLVLSLSTAGCADSGTASDNDKHGVFYGGASVGGTRP